MIQAQNILKKRKFAQTSRRDIWWVQPVFIFCALSVFIVYATWAALQGEHYSFGNYLSPFYSPELFGASVHSWFGAKPGWWPSWLIFSPAMLVLGGPVGFRLTCYYYRGAYYKAFWADPPACGVGEPRNSYLGENSLPLIIQNVHRYFLYVALIYLVILSHDVYKAMWFATSEGESFGIGVGTLVLLGNVICLSSYTFGCHSLRHIIGGVVDQLSKTPIRRAAYNCASCFNRKHMNWAWMSLLWVGFSDIYVRLCSMGIFTDLKIL